MHESSVQEALSTLLRASEEELSSHSNEVNAIYDRWARLPFVAHSRHRPLPSPPPSNDLPESVPNKEPAHPKGSHEDSQKPSRDKAELDLSATDKLNRRLTNIEPRLRKEKRGNGVSVREFLGLVDQQKCKIRRFLSNPVDTAVRIMPTMEDIRIADIQAADGTSGKSDDSRFRRVMAARSLANEYVEWCKSQDKSNRKVELYCRSRSQMAINTFKNAISKGKKLLRFEEQAGYLAISVLFTFVWPGIRLKDADIPNAVKSLKEKVDLYDHLRSKEAWYNECQKLYDSQCKLRIEAKISNNSITLGSGMKRTQQLDETAEEWTNCQGVRTQDSEQIEHDMIDRVQEDASSESNGCDFTSPQRPRDRQEQSSTRNISESLSFVDQSFNTYQAQAMAQEEATTLRQLQYGLSGDQVETMDTGDMILQSASYLLPGDQCLAQRDQLWLTPLQFSSYSTPPT